MMDPSVSDQQKATALRNAVKSHKDYTVDVCASRILNCNLPKNKVTLNILFFLLGELYEIFEKILKTPFF